MYTFIFIFFILVFIFYLNISEFFNSYSFRNDTGFIFELDNECTTDLTRYPAYHRELCVDKMRSLIDEFVSKQPVNNGYQSYYMETDNTLNLQSEFSETNVFYKNNLKEESTDEAFIGNYEFVKSWFIDLFNKFTDMYFKENFDNIGFKKYNNYKLIFDNLITYKTDNRLEEYIFNVKLYRESKIHHFNIECDIIIDNISRKKFIKSIKMLGVSLSEDIIFGELKSKNFYNENLNVDIEKIDYSLDNYNNDLQFEKKKINEYDRHICFNKLAKTKEECISPSKKRDFIGVWDKPCEFDGECPFYKANKNYPNKRGGCINGFCEMPINIKRLGYRKYDKNTKPFCYNCKKKECNDKGIICNLCCDKQKKYKYLLSPDYAFPYDYSERAKYRSSFESKDMSAINIIE